MYIYIYIPFSLYISSLDFAHLDANSALFPVDVARRRV